MTGQIAANTHQTVIRGPHDLYAVARHWLHGVQAWGVYRPHSPHPATALHRGDRLDCELVAVALAMTPRQVST
jgi:hypothetical protein